MTLHPCYEKPSAARDRQLNPTKSEQDLANMAKAQAKRDRRAGKRKQQ